MQRHCYRVTVILYKTLEVIAPQGQSANLKRYIQLSGPEMKMLAVYSVGKLIKEAMSPLYHLRKLALCLRLICTCSFVG